MHIRFLSFSSLLLFFYNYIGVAAFDWMKAASWVSCHDRQAIHKGRRSVLSKHDVSGRRAASLHLQTVGWIVPLVSGKQCDLSGALSAIADRANADSAEEQAGGLAAPMTAVYRNTSMKMRVSRNTACLNVQVTAMPQGFPPHVDHAVDPPVYHLSIPCVRHIPL
jgi:hypothetical protein